MFPPFYLIFAHNLAYQIGFYGSIIFIMLLPLAGIIKCGRIAKDPSANRRCVKSLMFLLMVPFLGGLAQILKEIFPAIAPFVVIFGLGAVGCWVLSPYLAISGLVDYYKKGTDTRGSRYAFTTLILNMVILGIVVSQVLMARNSVKARGEDNNLLLSNRPLEKQVLTFKSLNFKITVPSKPWVQIDAKKFNPAATVGLMRANPQIMFFVIAEKLNEDIEISVDTLVEVAKGNLRSVSTAVKDFQQKPWSCNGLNGVRLETDVKIKGIPFTYVHWVLACRNYCFQLVIAGSTEEKKKIIEEADLVFPCFNLINRPVKSLTTQPQYPDDKSLFMPRAGRKIICQFCRVDHL
jgi:hypothetical protein